MSSLRGVIHGRTIQLDGEHHLPEGQPVTIIVHPVVDLGQLAPGEGIQRSAGAWSDDPEGLEQYLAWNRQQRKLGRRGLEQ